MAFGVAEPVAHFPTRGATPAGWAYPVWDLKGQTPGVSVYDADFGASDSNVRRQIRDGFIRGEERLPLDAPTLTRTGRVSAQYDSLPAARFFQSYTGAGTGRSWSGGTTASTPQTLQMNFNPHMAGAAELHPATTYDPFPAPGSLYPKVV